MRSERLSNKHQLEGQGGKFEIDSRAGYFSQENLKRREKYMSYKYKTM